MISKAIFWFSCFFMLCNFNKVRYTKVLHAREVRVRTGSTLHYMTPFETETAPSPFEPFKRQTVTHFTVWANTGFFRENSSI